MVIVPLIFSSIVSGVSSVGEGKGIGRLGIKTFAYYLFSSLFAIMIGMTLANIVKPGVGANIPVNTTFDPQNLQTPSSPGEILVKMIPLNPIEAASSGHMLGIIFFSIFLGVAITKVRPQSQEFLKKLFNSFFDVMMKITEYIIKLAPLGILGLITQAVSSAGVGLFKSLGLYMFTILSGFSLHMFLVLPIIFYLTTRINPLLHFKAMTSAMLTAFSTCSSNATLPITMSNVEKKAGVSNTVSSFVLPMGATVNMNGTALYECAGVIFISQVLGMKLTLAQQFLIVLTALLSAIGAAGIPAAGVVVIFIVTQAVGFKDTDVGLIIGTMLAVDRPIDMFRTTVNIFSDSVGAVIIAKSEGESNLYETVR
jgi:Na+/H+-dicarboxylate symporter